MRIQGKSLRRWWGDANPVAKQRRKRLRAELVNKEPTILCPDCTGGILYHIYGLRFNSPTVNLMMFEDDFLNYVLDMDFYNRMDLVFYKDPCYQCPCAKLGDLTIHFTHYDTEEEARAKWNERKKRINKGNLFLFFYETADIPEEKLKKLMDLGARGILMFTGREYPDIPFALCLDKYRGGKVGDFKKRSFITDRREFETFFDFTSWFNEADGTDYSAEKYRR